MSLKQQIEELAQFTGSDYADVMKLREALILLAESVGEGGETSVKSRSFTFNRDSLLNAPIELELEPSGTNCVITSAVFNFNGEITYDGDGGIALSSKEILGFDSDICYGVENITNPPQVIVLRQQRPIGVQHNIYLHTVDVDTISLGTLLKVTIYYIIK
jgi:hypothetical protein